MSKANKERKRLSKVTKCALILAAAWVLCAGLVLAQESNTREAPLIIATELGYPPYSFLDENGQATGYNVDLTRAIAQVMQLDVEIRIGPWAEVRQALETGEIDAISGMFYSADRDKLVDFSPPYSVIHHAIFVRVGVPAIETEKDLRGKKIIVMRGDIMHDYVLEQGLSGNPVLVDTQADALRLLASGKHDCALLARLPGLYCAKELGLSNVETAGPLLRPSDYSYAVAEGNAALQHLLGEGLAVLGQTGAQRDIYDKWLGVLEPRGVSLRTVLKTIALVVVPLLVLLAFFAVWSRTLKRHVVLRTNELLASEERFKTIFEESPLGVALIDPHTGQIYEVNLRFTEIAGRTRAEMSTIDWMSITHPDDMQEDLDNMALLNAGKIPGFNMNKRYRRPDGSFVWINMTIAPITVEDKSHPRHLCMIEDITERKQAEEEREELIAKLEAQNAELERFTYTVSHDLKSPLITINGFVGMLRKDLAEGDSERVEEDLSRVANAADKMEQLLRDVLELSRIGRLVNTSEDVSLEEVAHEAHELVSGQTRKNGVHVEISSDLPVVFGDPLRLREVLQNLIDNAVKYMGDQPQPRVEIGSRRDGNETICYVQDNGIGIDPRYHEKVFGLFDQLDPKVEGSGIGLSLVKRIIEIHGGRIWIESEGSGHGATLCFTIAARSESTERRGAEPCTASH